MEQLQVIKHDMKVSELVEQNPYLLLMLEHLEIPLGLQDKTIDEVCSDHGMSARLFIVLANLFNGHEPDRVQITNSSDIKKIVDYLVNSHKHYLHEKFPLMTTFIEQIVEVNTNPEISLLRKFFEDYYNEVVEHLDYEHNVVFPYVTSLDQQVNQGNVSAARHEYSIADYQGHHDDIEEKLTDLKNLLVKYLPPHEDTQARRKLLLVLNELEFDLHIHSLIEEAILIPLVEEMEKSVNLQ
jgi:regulator of cell morphogenesis and NO signaling